MKLVERFIDFTHWPISRKAALLGCLSTPATLFAAVVNHLGHRFAPQASIDLLLLDRYLIVWSGVQIALMLLCLWIARTRSESRWIAYLYVGAQVPFMVGVGYLYGTMGSPLVMIFPTIIILWALYFDEYLAGFGLALVVAQVLITHVLELRGVLPYAPVLIARTIDAQRTAAWFSSTLMATLILFAFSFSICLLILAARRLQEQRLQRARHLVERNNRLIRRYVPAQLAEQIVSGGHHAASRPERRKLTIFFSEVEGFTDTSEEMDAEELATILNEYLSEMMRIADEYGATVNQLVGDSIMMFFGAPRATNDQDHALRAVRMALQMQLRMHQLLDIWFRRGCQRPFRIRIGINTGYASVGDYGSEGRKLYSGIGMQTNLAARIQAHCEPGRVLVSHSTWALIHDHFDCLAKGELQIKGVHYPIRVYELADGQVT